MATRQSKSVYFLNYPFCPPCILPQETLLANHSTLVIQPCPVFSQQPGAIFEIFDFLCLQSFTFCAEVFIFPGLFPCDRDKMAAKETSKQVREQLAAKATDTSKTVFLALLPCDRDKMAAKQTRRQVRKQLAA